MSTLEVFSTSGGYHEYIGAYHEYMGDVQYIEGCHDAFGGGGGGKLIKNFHFLLKTRVLNTPRCTHDIPDVLNIPQCTHDIPPVYS